MLNRKLYSVMTITTLIIVVVVIIPALDGGAYYL